MDLTDIWDDKKTDYSIIDEQGDKSTIRLPKWVADILQKELGDVHAWLQSQYRRVCESKPDLTRIKKGNIVRHIAETEARKSGLFISISDFL